ncbi:MAG: hypothetical protein ACOY3D_00950 [Candidatus Omnitrophota bacterium]
MLDPEKDELLRQAAEDKPAQKEDTGHLHKAISSIFGAQNILGKKNPLEKDVEAPGRYVPESTARKGIVFKILFLVALVLALIFFAKSQNAENQRLKLNGELAQADAEVKMLKSSLEKFEVFSQEGEQAKAELERFREKTQTLNKQLEVLVQERTGLAKQVKENELKIQQKDEQIVRLNEQLNSIKEDAAQQGENITAFAPAVSTVAPPAKKTGKVLVIKPATGIAAINLGSRDGVKTGMVFDIYTPVQKYVATLVIDELEETISLGKISPREDGPKVREGYLVSAK